MDGAMEGPLGPRHRRRPRPPLYLCTTEWDGASHGRPAAKGVLERSGGGAVAQGEPAGILAGVGRRADSFTRDPTNGLMVAYQWASPTCPSRSERFRPLLSQGLIAILLRPLGTCSYPNPCGERFHQ